MEKFFQYFDLFYKGPTCPHNNDDWERDGVTLFVLSFKSVGAVIGSKH